MPAVLHRPSFVEAVFGMHFMSRGVGAMCSGMLGARLADLLGGVHVRWMLISNYMLDLGWLLSAVPSILAAEQVILVHGERNNPPACAPILEGLHKQSRCETVWPGHATPVAAAPWKHARICLCSRPWKKLAYLVWQS